MLPETIDRIVLLQFAGVNAPERVGGGRLVTGKQFIREIFEGLRDTRPESGAVPSTFPLLRTLQLAAAAQEVPSNPQRRVIPVLDAICGNSEVKAFADSSSIAIAR
jgi:hypothetical protein